MTADFGWQDAAVALIVLAAVAWLVVDRRRRRRRGAACASCALVAGRPTGSRPDDGAPAGGETPTAG